MLNTKRFIKILPIVIMILVVVGYAYLKTKDYIAGPQITITSPGDGSSVSNSLIEIVGVAKNISFISLNDRPIFIDEKGNFKEKLLLYPGYNIMSIKAGDRYKRTVEKNLEIILLEQN
ncbi:MAG: hypothetical protein HZB09_01755 [Candidatus Yonathbacteria bacterium]|nr:hypothetical protein [Candidatus Yonathbacteria bacterium]